jgi:hypothetical protein
MADRQTMAIRLSGNPRRQGLRNARSTTGTWPAAIVVSDPFVKDAAEVSFTAGDHSVQALSTNGADHAFAVRVRLRGSSGRLENRQTRRHHRGIDALGVDAVTVVDDPSVRRIA